MDIEGKMNPPPMDSMFTIPTVPPPVNSMSQMTLPEGSPSIDSQLFSNDAPNLPMFAMLPTIIGPQGDQEVLNMPQMPTIHQSNSEMTVSNEDGSGSPSRKRQRLEMPPPLPQMPHPSIQNQQQIMQSMPGQPMIQVNQSPPFPCKCPYCGFQTDTNSLILHMTSHTPNLFGLSTFPQQQCPHCEHVAADVNELVKHLQTHYDADKYMGNLDYMKSGMDEKPFRCHYCNFSCKHASTLRTHLFTHTGEKPYKCTVCGHATTTAQNLRTHMVIHSGSKPYKCEHCEASFQTAQNLKIHLFTHGIGERIHRCDQCDYTCARLDQLKRHQFQHSGERPFKCSQCTFSTTSPAYLKKHMQTHGGVKKYKCNHCDYSTARKDHLQRHNRTHTGEKPFKCEHCAFSSAQPQNLKAHIRSKHPDCMVSPSLDINGDMRAAATMSLASVGVELSSVPLDASVLTLGS
eukprot:TRINITY_DN2701_c0_g1_i1.p1 TRINITY_DN2701_c0_g1~~TRINITY_DN2701_c0_g1_i1.p1  ORF type:complete len:459 (-),score=101.74 TRINITY_DN2701_c0_g1_i1:144-1520(-)